MSVFQLYGKVCNYDDTLTVSGAGPFYFDYLSPYLAVTDEGTAGSSVLKLYDTSAIGTPVLKSTTSLPASSTARHPRLHRHPTAGMICLIPYNQSKKLAVWNVNDMSSPSLLGEVAVSFAPNSVAAIDTLACVGFNESFLQTKSAERVDLTDLSAPVVTANWAVSKFVIEVRTFGNNFFLAGQNNSAGAVHLSALRASDFTQLSTATDGGAFAGINAGALKINAAGTRAFSLNIGNSGICSWDISNPSSISLIQRAGVLGAAAGTGCIAYREATNRAYVGRGSGGALQIDIINTSPDTAMTFAGSISTSGETVSDILIIEDGCAGLAWGQGTGAAIHLRGTPPLS